MKFVPSIITVHLLRSDELLSLKVSIRHHLSPNHFQSKNLFDRSMTENITLNDTTKLVILFTVTRSPIKGITSVQCAGNGIQKTGVNGYNVPPVNNGSTKHVFTFKSNF